MEKEHPSIGVFLYPYLKTVTFSVLNHYIAKNIENSSYEDENY